MEDPFADVNKAIAERRVTAYKPCQCDNKDCRGLIVEFKENGEEKAVCVNIHKN